MEVHHHAHTSRKKWTHYFWEFLMLFLAVFCGFLAENMREHAVEHKRAKVYATNLYKELKVDTANLKDLIIWTDSLIKRFDTLCIISTEPLRPSLVNNDPVLMKEFIGWVKSESEFWETNIRGHLKPMLKTSTELLQLLKEHYHLK